MKLVCYVDQSGFCDLPWSTKLCHVTLYGDLKLPHSDCKLTSVGQRWIVRATRNQMCRVALPSYPPGCTAARGSSTSSNHTTLDIFSLWPWFRFSLPQIRPLARCFLPIEVNYDALQITLLMVCHTGVSQVTLQAVLYAGDHHQRTFSLTPHREPELRAFIK